MTNDTPAPGEGLTAMDDAQIKHMVDRFLGWRLPKNFSPDNGISYTRPGYAPEYDATPYGTNLFDATQAGAMVRHMVKALAPPRPSPAAGEGWRLVRVDDLASIEAVLPSKPAELGGASYAYVDQNPQTTLRVLRMRFDKMLSASPTPPGGIDLSPIKMILFCPACGVQHIDAPDHDDIHWIDGARSIPWDNPPHRSHLCQGCGHIWRPADVPTEGVASIATQGNADSPSQASPTADAARVSEVGRSTVWEGGKCCVPVWSGDSPEGFCGEPAYGPQLPKEVLYRDRSWPTAPYCFGPCCPKHGGPEEGDPIIFQDGLTDEGRPMWCAVLPGFVDLQVSVAGFDGNPLKAREALRLAAAALRDGPLITRDQAKALAIRYEGYLSAKDSNGHRVWGSLFLESIAETGVFEDWRANVEDRVASLRESEAFACEYSDAARVAGECPACWLDIDPKSCGSAHCPNRACLDNEALLERAARTIAPEVWAVLDAERARFPKGSPERFQDKESLAVATRIRTIFTRVDASDGGTEAGRAGLEKQKPDIDLVVKGLDLIARHFGVTPLQAKFGVRGWRNMKTDVSQAFSDVANEAAILIAALRAPPHVAQTPGDKSRAQSKPSDPASQDLAEGGK